MLKCDMTVLKKKSRSDELNTQGVQRKSRVAIQSPLVAVYLKPKTKVWKMSLSLSCLVT